ncbi:hypothetical protein AWB76_06807 [Caballeronia temeraria]|uniref:Cupin n=1 Tax=Caballeronia temeraria TaxID=1777137 RepID=A0A158DCL9_9BURK|nr:hypothetical protein AWB76_06807 [Caballeronia temeraria]
MSRMLFRGLFVGLLAGCCVIHAYAADAAAYLANPETTVSTVLLKSDHSWDGTRYKSYPAGQPQLTVLNIVIPAHTALPWHTHPMPNAEGPEPRRTSREDAACGRYAAGNGGNRASWRHGRYAR